MTDQITTTEAIDINGIEFVVIWDLTFDGSGLLHDVELNDKNPDLLLDMFDAFRLDPFDLFYENVSVERQYELRDEARHGKYLPISPEASSAIKAAMDKVVAEDAARHAG